MNRTHHWIVCIALVALGLIGAVACSSTSTSTSTSTDASTASSGKPVLTLKGGAR